MRHDESDALRDNLSGRQCSDTLFNLCFERPLAIIRPDSPPKTASEILNMHGIETESSKAPNKQDDAASLSQEIVTKQ